MRRSALLALIVLALYACSDATGPSPTAPAIVSIGPNRARPNSGPFALVVNGRNFRDSSVVQWNGAPRLTTFVDSTRLVAFIDDQDVVAPATAEIRVVNPNGERSTAVAFVIADNAVAFGTDSIVPPCCGDASAGVTVAVYFNEPLDTASLGDNPLQVLDGVTPVAGAVSYDPATKSLRFSTPLAALRSYTARVDDRIHSTSGGALANPVVWNFTTARGALVILDSPGDFASLVLGADGRPRIAYRWSESVAFTMTLRLATCSGDCTQRTGWTTTTLDDAGGAGKVGLYASLAANSSGGLSVAYQDFGNDAAKYAAAGSGNVAVAGGGVGAFTSLAIAPANRLHLTYFAAGDLRSATCASSCLVQANWASTTVDTLGNVGAFSSVAVDAGGRVHVAYFEDGNGDLRYATCPGPCSPAAWTVGIVDTAGRVGIGSSLLVDSQGALHVTYEDQSNGTVKYATCSASCDIATNWASRVVATVAAPNADVGFYRPSLALGPGDQLEVAFANLVTGRYEGATCSTACAGAGAWTVVPLSLQGPGNFRLTSLKVTSGGTRHLAWTDAAGSLKYMQY
ncbi:MAG TPA: Ig-like domain-containing protein [Gemmatimonadales bacterium]|nr:Ig-like domain-containing protein [Gemmatimonadales bacterium]